jgi:rod shape-determining protein MreC
MSRGRKRLSIFLTLSLTSLALMTFQHTRQYNKNPFAFLKALSYSFDALNRLTANIDITIKEIWNTFEENKRLKKELASHILEKEKYGEIIQENKRLQEILSLKERQSSYVATARVISKGYDRSLNTMLLDKGAQSGIKKDFAVITANGLVGKIYAVKDNFSEVLLLRDVNFSAAVRLQNSRAEGVVSGTGYGYCSLKYIPPEEHVDKGETIITSGLDGIFPPGLPVGVVGEIKKEGVEFFQHIKVYPFQSDTKIEEVIILNNAPK